MKYQKIVKTCTVVKCGCPVNWLSKSRRIPLQGAKKSYTIIQTSGYSFYQAVDNAGINLPHPVEVIMNRWILQMGFPVVTINTQTGEITQKHFLLDSDSVVDTPSEFK